MKQTFIIIIFTIFCFEINAQNNLPSNFYLTKLSNGLEVLTIEDASIPLATVEIAVKNGSYTETPEYNGLSHLYEHMFFKANKDIASEEEFISRGNEIGMYLNGTTSEERVNYFFTLPSKYLKEGVKLMNSAIRYPLFLTDEMKKENPVVDGEFQRAESDPSFLLYDEMKHYLWGDLYSRKNVIGDHNIILTASSEKMKIIQGKYYHPNNSILVVAGDVKHDEVNKLAQTIFGDWKAADFDPFKKWPIPEIKPLEKSGFFIKENANAEAPMLLVSLHGPDTRNDIKGTYVADVLSFILNQKSSRLQKELIDSGLAYELSASYQTCKYTGPIYFSITPDPNKIKQVIAKLNEEISKWDTDNYFSDEQIETAKTLLAISDVRSKDAVSEYIHTITYFWATATLDYYTSYTENIKKVTRADINAYVQKYIKGKPQITGLLISPAQKASLKISSIDPK